MFLFGTGIGDGYSPCAFLSWPWSAQEDIATGAWSGYFTKHSWGMAVTYINKKNQSVSYNTNLMQRILNIAKPAYSYEPLLSKHILSGYVY